MTPPCCPTRYACWPSGRWATRCSSRSCGGPTRPAPLSMPSRTRSTRPSPPRSITSRPGTARSSGMPPSSAPRSPVQELTDLLEPEADGSAALLRAGRRTRTRSLPPWRSSSTPSAPVSSDSARPSCGTAPTRGSRSAGAGSSTAGRPTPCWPGPGTTARPSSSPSTSSTPSATSRPGGTRWWPGRRAGEKYANLEAATHYQRALASVGRLPDVDPAEVAIGLGTPGRRP